MTDRPLDWQHAGGFSAPGLGPRPTEWPSFSAPGPFGTANPSCAACGGRLRGARKCSCEEPDWRVRGEPVGVLEDAPAEGELPGPAWEGEGSVLYAGDCVEVMRALPAASVDAVVCDPPYGLEFMGKDWDRLDTRQIGDPTFHEVADYPGRVRHASAPSYGGGVGPAMQEWHTVWTREAFRVLKPGGHLLAFGGTRTYHRLACAVEDAGFEVRDMVEWFYGSGFPKSRNVSKAIDEDAGAEREVVGQKWADRYPDGPGGTSFTVGGEGADGSRTAERTVETAPATPEAARWSGWGTALKPGHEPIVLARKPLAGTVARNVLEHGTGALNIDGCRLEGAKDVPASPSRTGGVAYEGNVDGSLQNCTGDEPGFDPDVGRWPPNVALSHHDECELVGEKVVRGDGHDPADSKPSMFQARGGPRERGERYWTGEVVEDWNCHPDCPVGQLDEQTGQLALAGNLTPGDGTWRHREGQLWGGPGTPARVYADPGGASRFYYVAKASRAEREAGLGGLEPRRFAQSSGGRTDAAGEEGGERYGAEQIGLNKVKTVRNDHPTVKPIALMRWLVRLVTPPGGLVLDPFLGSGTTAIACELEGLRWLGVERDEGYAAIAEGRIRFWREHGEEGLRVVARREAADRVRALAAESGQLDLFGDAQV